MTTDINEHWMDDPYYEVESEESYRGQIFMVLAIVLLFALAAFHAWLMPPVVRFVITPPMAQTQLGYWRNGQSAGGEVYFSTTTACGVPLQHPAPKVKGKTKWMVFP